MRYLIVCLLVLSFVPLPLPHKYTVSVPNLNSGGCGYYAYYLSGKLPGSTIVGIRGNRHYMVYRNGFYYDGRGAYLPHVIWLWSLGDIEPISREELRGLLNDRSLWNTKFDLRDTAYFISL